MIGFNFSHSNPFFEVCECYMCIHIGCWVSLWLIFEVSKCIFVEFLFLYKSTRDFSSLFLVCKLFRNVIYNNGNEYFNDYTFHVLPYKALIKYVSDNKNIKTQWVISHYLKEVYTFGYLSSWQYKKNQMIIISAF